MYSVCFNIMLLRYDLLFFFSPVETTVMKRTMQVNVVIPLNFVASCKIVSTAAALDIRDLTL